MENEEVNNLYLYLQCDGNAMVNNVFILKFKKMF